MSLYVKLDAEYAMDPKVLSVSTSAELLFIRGLAFAKRLYETNGFIHEAQLRVVGLGIDAPDDCAAELCAVGLWIGQEDGWQIAAWLDHNDSVDQIAEKREADAARKRTARRDKRASSGRPDGRTAPSEDVQPDVSGRSDASGAVHLSESESESESESLSPHPSRSTNERPPTNLEERQRIETLAEELVLGESPGMVDPRDAGTKALGTARALARDLPPAARGPDVALAFARARSTWRDGIPTMAAIVRNWAALTAETTAPPGPARLPDYVPAEIPDALPTTTSASRARQARALTRSTP